MTTFQSMIQSFFIFQIISIFFSSNFLGHLNSAIFVVCMSVTCVAYTGVLCWALRRRYQQASASSQRSRFIASHQSNHQSRKKQAPQLSRNNLRLYFKTLVTVLLVTFVFVLSNTAALLVKWGLLRVHINIQYCIFYLHYVNSWANPVIYYAVNDTFRSNLANILKGRVTALDNWFGGSGGHSVVSSSYRTVSTFFHERMSRAKSHMSEQGVSMLPEGETQFQHSQVQGNMLEMEISKKSGQGNHSTEKIKDETAAVNETTHFCSVNLQDQANDDEIHNGKGGDGKKTIVGAGSKDFQCDCRDKQELFF